MNTSSTKTPETVIADEVTRIANAFALSAVEVSRRGLILNAITSEYQRNRIEAAYLITCFRRRLSTFPNAEILLEDFDALLWDIFKTEGRR